MSVFVDIAEAVKDALNGSHILGSSTAVRAYAPEFTLKELDTLRVTVVASGQETTALSRKNQQVDVTVEIGVQKHLDDPEQETAELDALMDLVEKITDFVKTIEPLPGVSWVRSANAPIYAPEHLIEDRTFTSVIILVFRGAVE